MKFIRPAIFLLLTCAFANSFAQEMDINLIFREGNRLYDERQYIKAMRFYKEVLDIDPNYAGALYQMGECHRMTFDYESAVYYYEKVAKNAYKRFPLSTLHYAQMLKRTGEYNQAVQYFESFEQSLRAQNLHEDERYRNYYKQATIEKEGCLIALNDLTNPRPDRGFKILGAEVNSPYMDYAAFSYKNEEYLCVTSSRDEGKGKYIDYRFGESFAHIFRYQLVDSAWIESEEQDDFERKINTKWGEGSGSFNADATKFYYTNCDETLGDKCRIYYSSRDGNNWSEPRPLNESINGDYNSRHPFVSPTGDTLFFASDRPGGEGQYDIWMSLNAGGENWSRAQNLGPQINTSFNELSPFYDTRQEVLFFASDGHRGYGGFDIFAAKGLSFFDPEIFNPGYPFNSNRDEFFMFLGETKGYVSSNRDGGFGKLDIYQFDVDANEAIITEITNDEFIAGANSLFSDDYDFDSENIELVNEVISSFLAADIADVDLALTEDLAAFYEGLSKDDKDRINRIIQARMRKLSETELQALRIEDEFYYHNLNSEDKGHMDHLIMTYIEENELALSVSVPSEDKEFYENLPIEEREKADQLIASRLKQADAFEFIPTNYEALTEEEQQKVDGLANDYITQKKNISNLPLSPNEAIFLNGLDVEKKDQVYQAIKERMLTLAGDDDFGLTDEDRIFYQNLSSEHHDALKEIAHSFILSDVENIEANLDKEMVQIFDLYNSSQRGQLNKLLLKLINNVIKSDLYFTEANLTPEARIALQSFQGEDVADFINTHMNNLNLLEEIEISERFLTTTGLQWKNTNGVFFTEDELELIASGVNVGTEEQPDAADEALTADLPVDADETLVNSENMESTTDDTDEPRIPAAQAIAPSISGQEAVMALGISDMSFYENLTDEQKKTIDRSIARDYLEEYDDNPQLESQDQQYRQNLTPSERTYLKLLTTDLKPGEELSRAEEAALNEAFAFYSNLSPAIKKIWNRLVAREVLEKSGDRYVNNAEDVAFLSQLSQTERTSYESIKDFRFANDRILSEDFLVEANDLSSSTIDFTMARFNSGNNRFIAVSGQLIRNNDGTPLSNYQVNVMNERDELVAKAITNKNGYFNIQDLPKGSYRIVLDQSVAENSIEAPVFVKDLEVLGSADRKYNYSKEAIVYFDFDSYQLRSEAGVTLKEIAAIYKKQKVYLELGSHTDNLGSEQYNMKLSNNRNQSALAMLEELGIKVEDIKWKSFGQSKPVASNETPYGRQFNRRLEIMIKSESPVNYSPADVFMVRPKGTLYSISKNFKVDIEQVKAYNGMKGNDIEAFRPLRIPNPNDIKPNLNMLVALNASVALSNNTYIVREHDTLASIARKFNIPEELIIEMNDLKTANLTPGQQLNIYIRN